MVIVTKIVFCKPIKWFVFIAFQIVSLEIYTYLPNLSAKAQGQFLNRV